MSRRCRNRAAGADAHLLASARLARTSLWTLDRRLASATAELERAAEDDSA